MLAIIAAKSKNNVIGFEGKMPWKQKHDLLQFKALTYSHTVIMGRKTFESLGGKPLIDRRNIVITSNVELLCEMYPLGTAYHGGITVTDNFTLLCNQYKTLMVHDSNRHGFIIGGERLYREGLSIADVLYITELDCNIDGDAFFPDIDLSVWEKVVEEKYKADENNQYDYSFIKYVRIELATIDSKA